MKTCVRSFRYWYLLLALLAASAVELAVAQDPGFFPTVTIRATDSHAGEGGSNTGTITVTRHVPRDGPPPETSLVVFYQVSGTASNGVDYQTLSGSVTIPALAFGATITVTPIDDDAVEGEETVVVQLTGSPLACAACGYNIGVPSNAVVVIADNDMPPQTNRPPFVHLNAPRSGDVFTAPAGIALRAYAQDAEDGNDLKVEFFEGTNSLGFGIFVPTLCPSPYCPFFALDWSNVPPGNYTLTARATDSGGARSVSDEAHITVLGGVNIYATDPEGSEIHSAPNFDPPSNPAVFIVRRFGETNDGIVVYYEVGGTASNGVDYVKLPGEVTIPAGARSAEIVVRPIDDNLVEGTETVVITLLPPCPQCLFANPMCEIAQGTNCYPIGPDAKAVAYIHDNDTETPHPPFVHLNTPQAGDTFVVPADIELVAFAQDAEDGYNLLVEFFEGTNSLGLGSFLPGRCATCPNYVLTWSNVPPGEYKLTAKATDSDGASSVSDPVPITVTVFESNRPPVVNIVARDPLASEGTNFWHNYPDARIWASDTWNSWHVNVGGTNTATFVVSRHGPTNDELTVNYEIGGTASNGVDYVALSGAATIPAGKRTAQIVVVPFEDMLAEGIETVVLKLRASSNYTAGFPSRAAAIIIDNDRPRPPCVLLPDHQFHFCLPASNGFCFRVEASTDLQNWIPICTNVVTDGALHFVDPDAPSLNARFYRVQPEAGLPPDD